jgi:hypothetical protein
MRYIIIFLLIYQAICGPIAYAACQAACAGVAAVAAGGGAWMAMPAVMAAYSTCQSACAAALLAPTP